MAVKKVETINNHADPNDQGVPVLVLREGVLLKRLDHANIVAMRDIFVHENTFHFVRAPRAPPRAPRDQSPSGRIEEAGYTHAELRARGPGDGPMRLQPARVRD